MFMESISHEGMTNEEILLSDLKKYDAEGTSFVISTVECYGEDEVPGLIEGMKAVMPEVLTAEGVEYGFVQISIFHDELNVNYIVPPDDIAAEILETAFEDEGEWEDAAYALRPGVSRRKVLAPRLTEALLLHPGE